MDLLEQISLAGLVSIIKVEKAEDAVPLCNALVAGGLPTAEITFRTSAAAEAIALVKQNVKECMLGAGTVLTVEQAKEAVDAGAAYILTPGFNPKVVEYCVTNNIPILPGCGCGGDVEAAIEFGLKAVKIFPAEALGGLKFIKALSGPYNKMKFVPTGGVNEDNMNAYLAQSCVLAVGGSWIAPADLIKAGEFDKIKNIASESVKRMLGFELKHIGINNPNAEDAMKGAKMLAAITGLPINESAGGAMVGSEYEFIKGVKAGTHGHIAIGTNNITRAMWHLNRRGFELEQPLLNAAGKVNAVYLKDEICGFAVHLLQK